MSGQSEGRSKGQTAGQSEGKTPGYAPHDMLEALSSRFVDPDAIPWDEAKPGQRAKVLYKDDAAREAWVLVETDPGFVIEDHLHTGLECTFVLEGSMVDQEGTCEAGNFVWRPEGSRHEVTTPDGSRFLTYFRGGAMNMKTGRVFPDFGAEAGKEAAE